MTQLAIRRDVTVNAPVEEAFDVFTSGMSQWLKKHSINDSPQQNVVLEPRPDGKWGRGWGEWVRPPVGPRSRMGTAEASGIGLADRWQLEVRSEVRDPGRNRVLVCREADEGRSHTRQSRKIRRRRRGDRQCTRCGRRLACSSRGIRRPGAGAPSPMSVPAPEAKDFPPGLA